MDWLDLLVVQGTLQSLLQHHSSKASILWRSAFFIVQLSHPYITTGKTIALIGRTFVGKVMSLLFSMLSRLVTAFLPRSRRLLISWLQSPCSHRVFSNESVLRIRRPEYGSFSFGISLSNEYSGLISFRITDKTEKLKNSPTRGSRVEQVQGEKDRKPQESPLSKRIIPHLEGTATDRRTSPLLQM